MPVNCTRRSGVFFLPYCFLLFPNFSPSVSSDLLITRGSSHGTASSSEKFFDRIICSAPMSADASQQGVYVILVTGKLKAGQIAQFVENFKPLAKYVAENEEGTLTYQLSTGGDDLDGLCIYERYTSKEYLETVHWQSTAFKALGAKNAADGLVWESKQISKYYETDVGFMAK